MEARYSPLTRHDVDDAWASNHGSGTDEVLEVIELLETAGIPVCVVGVMALRYFGAGRVDDLWELCVSDNQMESACRLFESPPLSSRYERTTSPGIVPFSLRHLYPTFKLRGVIFCFLLTPSSDSFCDPREQFCERSHMNIPYPQDVYFARSLLVRQVRSDLADFIDAQNLSVEWGEENLDFPNLQTSGKEYARWKNEKLESAGCIPGLSVDRDFARMWKDLAETKEFRIEPMKKGRYITRWRSKARPLDPRKKDPTGRYPTRKHV